MISVFKNLGPNLDQSTQDLIVEMITHSENPASDALMRKIDAVRGPLVVSNDLKAIGLQNTFMAGFFCSSVDPCPPLQHFDTPANMRTDVSTDPDVYNQTTPSDMGTLLADLYYCSKDGSGPLVKAFPDKFNPDVCKTIIGYLERDKIGSLIEAGLPEGTQIAHKHGWTPNYAGITQDFSDAAIVYTPGGDYVLVVYTHHPVQALGVPVARMFAQISQAVYDYFNAPAQ
jgi:beta-lactamase class A